MTEISSSFICLLIYLSKINNIVWLTSIFALIIREVLWHQGFRFYFFKEMVWFESSLRQRQTFTGVGQGRCFSPLYTCRRTITSIEYVNKYYHKVFLEFRPNNLNVKFEVFARAMRIICGRLTANWVATSHGLMWLHFPCSGSGRWACSDVPRHAMEQCEVQLTFFLVSTKVTLVRVTKVYVK